METLLLISTTVESTEDAERLASLLLEHKLIACAHISSPVISLYRWRGQKTRATEMLLSVKTVKGKYQQVRDLLLQEHPYELPEIVAQEIPVVSDDYARWVQQEVS